MRNEQTLVGAGFHACPWLRNQRNVPGRHRGLPLRRICNESAFELMQRSRWTRNLCRIAGRIDEMPKADAITIRLNAQRTNLCRGRLPRLPGVTESTIRSGRTRRSAPTQRIFIRQASLFRIWSPRMDDHVSLSIVNAIRIQIPCRGGPLCPPALTNPPTATACGSC